MSTTAFAVEECSGEDKCLGLFSLLVLFLLAERLIGGHPDINGLRKL
jgi:hypothetical protein